MKIFNKKFLSVSLSVLVSVLFVSAVVYASTTVGLNIETGGNLLFNGSTSGTVTVKPQAEAGTWSLALPANDGDSGQVLSTDGAGITSWASVVTALGFTPENVANKDTDGSLASDSDTKYPSQKAVKTYVDANSRPYLVYTALLSQSGTDAPVATVLENTLGGTVVWTRSGIGNYVGTLAGVFTINKTISPLFGTGGGIANMPLYGTTPMSTSYYISPLDVDTIRVDTMDSSGNWVELSDYPNVLVEIRVYP